MLFLIGFRVRLIQFYWCDPLDGLFFRRDESSGSGTIQRLSYSRVRIADRRRVFMNLAIWQAIKQRSRRSLIRIWVNGMPKGGRLLLTAQVVAVFLASIAMSLALAHALELPGKMRLSKENYIATQTIYYPGFTIGGASEGLSMLAVLILLFLTPANIQAFWWTLAGLIGLAAMHAVYLDSHASGKQVLDEGHEPQRCQWGILRGRRPTRGCGRNRRFGRKVEDLSESMGIFARLSSGTFGGSSGIADCRRRGAWKWLRTRKKLSFCRKSGSGISAQVARSI
jgi:hypothetical protein